MSLLPSHEWTPSLLTAAPVVCTVVRGTSVFAAPSTRRVTLAACALDASARRTSSPAANGPESLSWATESHPFPRGRIGLTVGGRSPGSRSVSLPRLPGARGGLQWQRL